MSRKLFFVRHGQSMGNVWPDAYENEPMNFLSPLGEEQARHAGRVLAEHNMRVDIWNCSELTRARHTLSLISSTMDDWQRPYVLDERLNENHMWETDAQHQDAVVDYCDDYLQHFLTNPAYEDKICGVVSHWFTMRYLFGWMQKRYQFNRYKISGYTDYIPNATLYLWDEDYPMGINWFHPREEVRNEIIRSR